MSTIEPLPIWKESRASLETAIQALVDAAKANGDYWLSDDKTEWAEKEARLQLGWALDTLLGAK